MRKVIAVTMLALLATHASADPAAADAEVKLAEVAALGGDFVGAASHYKLAYAADARPELICNAGVAYYKAKDVTRAHLYLSRCQERGTALDPAFVSAVRTALAAVEGMLRGGEFTPVDIVASPDGANVTIGAFGETDAFVGSRLVWLSRGRHTLTVRAEGYVAKVVELEAQGAERQPMSVTLERQVLVRAPAVVAPPGTDPRLREPDVQTIDRPSKVPAFVALGGTVVAFVVSGIAYAQAKDSATMAREAISIDVYNDDKATTTTWNRVSAASGIVGILGAGLSGYLIFKW
jgi:hypothetical protein